MNRNVERNALSDVLLWFVEAPLLLLAGILASVLLLSMTWGALTGFDDGMYALRYFLALLAGVQPGLSRDVLDAVWEYGWLEQVIWFGMLLAIWHRWSVLRAIWDRRLRQQQ